MQIQNIYVTIFYWRKLFMHFYCLEKIAMYFVVDFIIGRIYETWNTLLLMNKDCEALYFLVRMVKSFLFPVVNIMCALAEIILIKKHCFFPSNLSFIDGTAVLCAFSSTYFLPHFIDACLVIFQWNWVFVKLYTDFSQIVDT